MSDLTFQERALKGWQARAPLPAKEPPHLGPYRKKVVVISGPTAVGKTALSLKIAKAIGGQIISADSMQVYRGMDIGTAKPSVAARAQVPHHLVDSRELDETYNVAQFYEEASQAIREVLAKGAVPIVVGGTGFYIHALLYGPPAGPPSDETLRKELEAEMHRLGAEQMFDRLKSIDPDYAATITKGDKHKIIRGLEIVTLANQKVSDFKNPSSQSFDLYDFRCWFLYYSKEILYRRIEERCDQMIEEGLIEEVKRLEADEALSHNQTASMAIGYRQCLDYLRSAQTDEDWNRFVYAFKQASRRYAKRQLTWFRKEPLFRWVDLGEADEEISLEMIIQDYELGGPL